MTPKEKAMDLAIKFCDSSDVVKPNIGSVKRALICVEEILKAREVGKTGVILDKEYWEEVSDELNAL